MFHGNADVDSDPQQDRYDGDDDGQEQLLIVGLAAELMMPSNHDLDNPT